MNALTPCIHVDVHQTALCGAYIEQTRTCVHIVPRVVCGFQGDVYMSMGINI